MPPQQQAAQPTRATPRPPPRADVRPRQIASFLEAGIVEALNMAGRDEDDEVRVLTTTALARLAREPNARAQMVLAGSVGVLLQLARPEKEKVEAVRATS